MSLTYIRIKEQYKELAKSYEHIMALSGEISKFYDGVSAKSIAYMGCGSGYCLCRSGEASARIRLGLPSMSFAAGDLMLNYQSYAKILKDTLFIAPSRSGQTTEVINAVKNVKSVLPAPVLGISCVEKSPLGDVADYTIDIPWAFDECVCQTATVANLYTANLLILAALSGDNRLAGDIRLAIEAGEGYMHRYEADLKRIAGEDWTNVVMLADGELQGLAGEGAMAFTEIAEIPSVSYHLLDVRHGPTVLIDGNTLVIACLTGKNFGCQKALIGDLLKRGARIVTYSDKKLEDIEGVSLQVNSGLELDYAAQGIPFIFIPQILAYYKAVQKGINADEPNGLDPWIKL